MPARFDAAIAGGGLAGLSLAVHLARVRPDHRMLIVDDPTAATGWNAGDSGRAPPGPFDAAISQRFTTIRLYAHGRAHIPDSRWSRGMWTPFGVWATTLR
jgi:glycine/D-amino acid oxidase-like deaminating enzyme